MKTKHLFLPFLGAFALLVTAVPALAFSDNSVVNLAVPSTFTWSIDSGDVAYCTSQGTNVYAIIQYQDSQFNTVYATNASLVAGTVLSWTRPLGQPVINVELICTDAFGTPTTLDTYNINVQSYTNATYPLNSIASTTLQSISNANQDYFNGFLLFFISMALIIWVFKKR